MGNRNDKARELYLKTYGTIDRMDHIIKNCKMHCYGVWKGDWRIKPGQKRKEWTFPTEVNLAESSQQMKQLRHAVCKAAEGSANTTLAEVKEHPIMMVLRLILII